MHHPWRYELIETDTMLKLDAVDINNQQTSLHYQQHEMSIAVKRKKKKKKKRKFGRGDKIVYFLKRPNPRISPGPSYFAIFTRGLMVYSNGRCLYIIHS